MLPKLVIVTPRMFWCCSCTKLLNPSKEVLDELDYRHSHREDEKIVSCFDKFWPNGRNKKIGASPAPDEPNCSPVVPQWTQSQLPKWVVTRSSSCNQLSPDSSKNRKLSRGNAITQRFLFAHEKLLQKLGSTTSPIVMGVAEDGNNNETPIYVAPPCYHQSEMFLKRYHSYSSSTEEVLKSGTGSLPQILWVPFSCIIYTYYHGHVTCKLAFL